MKLSQNGMKLSEVVALAPVSINVRLKTFESLTKGELKQVAKCDFKLNCALPSSSISNDKRLKILP